MSVKPAITFITNHLDGGGVEKVFLTLMNNFCSRGIEVNLILTQKKGVFLDELDKGVRITDLNCRLRTAFWPLFRELRGMGHSKVICGPQFMSFLVIIISSILGNKLKVVATHHSLNDRDVKNLGFAGRFDKLLIRLLYRRAYKVVAVSNGVVRYLTHDVGLPGRNVQLIYNPVITPSLLARATQPVEEPWLNRTEAQAVPTIVAVGRLGEIKRFDLLVEAVKDVLEKMPVRLLLVGDGPQRLHLEQKINELRMAPFVKITGFKSNPYPYIAAADVFVSSSESETFSLVIAEALYLGTPVVATKTIGAMEVLDQGKFGTLIPINDKAALASAIQQCLQVEEKPVIPETDRLQWLEKFNIDIIAAKYINLMYS